MGFVLNKEFAPSDGIQPALFQTPASPFCENSFDAARIRPVFLVLAHLLPISQNVLSWMLVFSEQATWRAQRYRHFMSVLVGR